MVVSNADLGGDLDQEQLKKMFASGYRFNPESQCFHRLFAGEPGAPVRPWTDASWPGAKRKRGFFRRS